MGKMPHARLPKSLFKDAKLRVLFEHAQAEMGVSLDQLQLDMIPRCNLREKVNGNLDTLITDLDLHNSQVMVRKQE